MLFFGATLMMPSPILGVELPQPMNRTVPSPAKTHLQFRGPQQDAACRQDVHVKRRFSKNKINQKIKKAKKEGGAAR